MSTVISVENLSKAYQLGQIGTGTLTNDLKLWWAKARGKPNPLLRIGESDHGNRSGETIWALKDVSFEVQQGEALGVIGRNGAGKSTLLKILSRITAPTSGRVKVKGRIASLLEVGTGFHPELTGRENIYLNGAILGMRRDEVRRKFDEIVDFAGIAQFVDTPVKRYSSGMYVRLAFAVAAHLEPEILLVDEVLAVGDAEFQKKCLGKMGEVASEGRTVLFVSHNMAAVSFLCNKVVVMNLGTCSPVMEKNQGVNSYINSSALNDHFLVSHVVNLSTIKERKGTGPIRFTGFSCEDQHGNKVQQFISGEMGNLVLDYQTSDTVSKLEDIEVSIVVYTIDGIRICNLSNYYQTDESFRYIPDGGQFVCSLPKVPFRTGQYLIDVWCGNNVIVSDWIQYAASFQVVDGDYYKSGKLTRNSKGYVFVDHKWSVKND